MQPSRLKCLSQETPTKPLLNRLIMQMRPVSPALQLSRQSTIFRRQFSSVPIECYLGSFRLSSHLQTLNSLLFCVAGNGHMQSLKETTVTRTIASGPRYRAFQERHQVTPHTPPTCSSPSTRHLHRRITNPPATTGSPRPTVFPSPNNTTTTVYPMHHSALLKATAWREHHPPCPLVHPASSVILVCPTRPHGLEARN